MMLSLVLLSVSLVIGASQSARARCVPAKQFRGNLQLFYYNIGTGKTTPRMIKIAYDGGLGQRVKIQGRDRQRNSYTLVQLYKEGKQYLVIDSKCTRLSLQGTFPTLNIPSNAKKVGEGRIGTNQYGVDFKRYSGGNRLADKREMFIPVETEAGGQCVFSYSLAYVQGKDTKEIFYSSLSDITLSIDDLDFTRPLNCPDAPQGFTLPEGVVATLDKVRGF